MLRLHPLYDPWREFRAAVRQMDDVFRTYDQAAPAAPGFDVQDNDDAYIIDASLPGLKAEDMTIDATANSITLQGKRSVSVPEGYRAHRRERRDIEFSRTFKLPSKVDVDQISASFDNGVLHLELPKAPEAKPRRISLSPAAEQPVLTAE